MTDFVGRTDELAQLKQRSFNKNSGQVISILGLGGVGKSRLALEFVCQIKSEHRQYSILWVQATDQSTFEKDILEIGRKLDLPGIEDDKADVKGLVKQRLNNSQGARCILVLDNADDEALWCNKSAPKKHKSTFVDWLPSTSNCSVLVTTRSRRVASYLSGKEIIELRAMSVNEAQTIFINVLEKSEMAADQNALSDLLDRLAYLPLAVVQAASYLNMTQEPVTTYLELMDGSEEEVIDLLSEDFGDRTRYLNAHNPIAVTWLISFEQIRQNHPLAARFLGCMACLHEKSIPLSLLPEISPKLDVVNSMATLKGYSFVTRQTGHSGETEGEALYDMHQLVRLAARNWLKMRGTLPEIIKTCITRMAWLFPKRDPQFKRTRSLYLPHARRLCAESCIEDLSERFDLLEKIGLCLIREGRYTESVELHKAVVHWREQNLGRTAQKTLQAYSNLGEALNWSGSQSLAETYIQQALKGQKELPGLAELDALFSMVYLASVYHNQGRWKDAEVLRIQAMETSSRMMGMEHPDTLSIMNDLAVTYKNQGRRKEAEDLEVQVVEIRKRKWGLEHPDTLTSIGNLALTYKSSCRLKDAEGLELQVLEMRKRLLGTEHPDTLAAMNNLASTYKHKGQWKEAEGLDRQVMETTLRVLGREHPDTLCSMNNLAHALKYQKRNREATELMTSCARLCMDVFGPLHHHTQSVLVTLAEWRATE